MPWHNGVVWYHDVTVTIGGSPLDELDIGFDLPTGSVPFGESMNIESVITGVSGCAGIGLGISGDKTKYGELTALAKNSKATKPPVLSVLDSGDDLKLYATDGSGAPTGYMQDGSVRVVLAYVKALTLPDA